MKNQISFKVYGRYALFTDPLTKIGGEKFTYQIPTQQALKGICESIYWKPTFQWVIDEVRIMNQIRTESKGIRPLVYDKKNTLANYTYLANVEYQVKAHFEWDMKRVDLRADRNENKHYFVAKRMLERGGRRDVFLGTRECQAYVEPIQFGTGEGLYDGSGELQFGLMFYCFDYPNQTGKEIVVANFWRPKMIDGYISYKRDNAFLISKELEKMDQTTISTSGFGEQGLLDGYEEGDCV